MTPMNLPVKQNRGHRNRLVVTKREVVEGVMVWEAGVSRCKRSSTEWTNNEACSIAQRTMFNIV